MQLRILLLASFCLLYFACQNNGATKTKSGYPVTFHIDEPGPVPDTGQWVIFDVYKFRGDEVVNSTKITGRKATLQIKPEMYNQPLSALFESVLLLSEGDSITVTQSLDSIDKRPPGYENETVIRYDVQIEEIYTQEEYDSYMDSINLLLDQNKQELLGEFQTIKARVQNYIESYKRGTLGNQLLETENGVKVVTLKAGTGPKAEPNKTLIAHFGGFLMDGTAFDSSYERGKPTSFSLGTGNVIAGLEEGLFTLNQGSTAVIFIPARLAYGASGFRDIIPPNSDLVFYVSLQNVSRI